MNWKMRVQYHVTSGTASSTSTYLSMSQGTFFIFPQNSKLFYLGEFYLAGYLLCKFNYKSYFYISKETT